MSAVRLAGVLSGIFVCLAGAFLLHLSQSPAQTTETFTTVVWSSETGLVFDKSRPIPPGEKTNVELRSEPIHMGDWVQMSFMLANGTLDVLVKDYDGETIRDVADVSGRVKIAFFAPRESLYYLVLVNSKSNTSITVLDFHQTIYSLTTSSLIQRIEVVPRPLPITASFMIIAVGLAAAAYAFMRVGGQHQ